MHINSTNLTQVAIKNKQVNIYVYIYIYLYIHIPGQVRGGVTRESYKEVIVDGYHHYACVELLK